MLLNAKIFNDIPNQIIQRNLKSNFYISLKIKTINGILKKKKINLIHNK